MTLARIAALVVIIAAALLLPNSCRAPREPTYQGWVEAELIFVGPDEAGRIETLAVQYGQNVERGALLFALDDELQRADLVMQQAALKNAQVAFERAQALLKTAAGTQRAYDEAEAALRTAEARVNSSQTRLQRRKVQAPVTGSVQQIYFRVGELVAAGKPVVALLPPGNLKVRFFVNETVLAQIKLGQHVRITCDGCGPPIAATVTFIAQSSEFTPPVIYSMEERAKLVFMIEARTETPERLRVGQPVSVALGDAGP